MNYGDLSRGRVFRFSDERHTAPRLGPKAFAMWVKVNEQQSRIIADDILYGPIPSYVLVRDLTSERCQACYGRGYMIKHDPANRPYICRCMGCEMFETDWHAARVAIPDGLTCRPTPPYLITKGIDLTRFIPPQSLPGRPLRSVIIDVEVEPVRPPRPAGPVPIQRGKKSADRIRSDGRRIRFIDIGGGL